LASWAEFESAEPIFAARVRKLMTSRKHLTMATLRKDGSPRISGTEIQIREGQVTIGSMTDSLKSLDLRRDPRIAIHGPTNDPTKSGGWRGEAKIAGRAIEIPSGHGGNAFRIEIEEAAITSLSATRDSLAIESWTPKRGYRLGMRA
jgi:hypothetical protein